LSIERRLVKFSDAVDLLCSIQKTYCNHEDEEYLLEILISSCKKYEDGSDEYIDAEELSTLASSFIKALEQNDISFLTRKKGYKKLPVDIEEFLESPEYMNQKGVVRPVIKYELQRLFAEDRYVEVILSGSTGVGKSYFSEMAMSYLLYKLSCLHNPQAEYDLAPGSLIVFVLQSVSEAITKKILYIPMRNRIGENKYFKENFYFNKHVESEMQFPNNIVVMPVSSSEIATIGLNVYGGVLSEVNYMDVIENSKILKSRGSMTTIYDQADRNYTNIIQRMKGRFQSLGKIPGLIILDSAVHYEGDFLSRKIAAAKNDPTIFVFQYAQWEVLPQDRFSGEKFRVDLGDKDRSPRILQPNDEPPIDARVIEVPIEYKKDFERNIEFALRDIAGIAVGMKHSFITCREALRDAFNRHLEIYQGISLFKEQEVDFRKFFGKSDNIDYSELVNLEYLKQVSFDITSDFALHLDLGVSGDSTGLAIGHISDYIQMPSTSYYSSSLDSFVEVTDVMAPVYTIDGLLRINPPYEGEIDLEILRGLCFYLCDILSVEGKSRVKFATLDRYESTMFIQAFRKLNIRSGPVSVVTTPVPYLELKHAINENRIIIPPHEHFRKEMLELIYDPKKDKIDHPPEGSKDLADAVASVIHILQRKLAKMKKSTVERKLDGKVEESKRRLIIKGRETW